MIEKMSKYSFILLKGEETGFLARLQELGVVDITRSSKPVDERSAQMLARISSLGTTLGKLSVSDFSKDPDYETILEESKRIEVKDDPVAIYPELVSKIRELAAEISAAEKEKDYLDHWGRFDKESLSKLEEMGLKIRYYSVPAKKFDAEWTNLVPLKEIYRDDSTVWFVTVSDDPEYSFPVKEIHAPETTGAEKGEEINALRKELLSAKAMVQAIKSRVPELEAEKKAITADMDMYFAEVSPERAAEDHVLVFEGFAPIEEDERLKEAFDKQGIFYIKDTAVLEDNPPIKLKNNGFTSQFRVLTDMYGRPSYDEFDPTPMISIFFLLFFAMCMGDAGYGLILIIVGLLMKRSKGFASMASLVVTLGIGTLLVGIVLHTFFGIDMKEWTFLPSWMQKVMLPTQALGFDAGMVLAIIVGIVHICVAQVVKSIMSTRNKGFLNSLGTWGWTLLIVGGVTVGGIALTGVLDARLTKWIIIILGSLSAVGIFLLNDVRRNVFANIGAGLWETYNTASGLLGDVLSYLRLYALGLAGAMLGGAFNQLGEMVLGDGKNLFLWIPCIILFLLGHTLNIAMCALGAFVHPLRLNFLEFFKNSGYAGKGRTYKPLEQINN